MASWYYFISPVPAPTTQIVASRSLEDRVDLPTSKPDGARILTPVLPQSIPAELPTVSRKEMPKPAKLIRIQSLTKEKRAAGNPVVKEAIKKQLADLTSNSFIYKGRHMGRIYDLQGNLIGRIHSRENSPYQFVLGDPQYIGGFDFYFVEKANNNTGTSGKLCICTSAYLTDEGKAAAERYLGEYFRSALSPSERRRLYQRGIAHRSHDLSIDGYITHLNLKGKVSLFIPCLIDFCLKDGEALPKQSTSSQRFYQYTQYSPVKKWVGETNEAINGFIGQTFKNLSTVLNVIFKEHIHDARYTQPPP